jgi:isopenicillin N synthase-like dioxygenase
MRSVQISEPQPSVRPSQRTASFSCACHPRPMLQPAAMGASQQCGISSTGLVRTSLDVRLPLDLAARCDTGTLKMLHYYPLLTLTPSGNFHRSQVGYMINERDEIFEAKVFHDSRWPWPRGDVQRDVLAMRELLHTVALACLRSLAAPLGLDAEKLHAHLDRTNPHDGSLRGSLEHCSNTSMRIYRYAARGLGNNVHTDNTLLTVSPPGSAIGLCASMPPRPDGQGGAARSRVVRPEAHMAPDELLLFAGDALSFLSRGRIPALVHWVEAPPGEAPRFSMPFFLRPRLDALLDPDGAAAAGPVKVGNPAGDVDERAAAQAGMMGDGRHLLVAVPPLQPVLQRAIEANVHNVRRSWPWKQGNDYYAPAVYPSDEGHAPVAVQLLTT